MDEYEKLYATTDAGAALESLMASRSTAALRAKVEKDDALEARHALSLISAVERLSAALKASEAEVVRLRAVEARYKVLIEEPATKDEEQLDLKVKVRSLEYSLKEMDQAHRREYQRAVELANARAEALRVGIKLKTKPAYEHLEAMQKALRSVPDCGMCRDDPKAHAKKMGWNTVDAICTSCGKRASS